VRQGQRGRFAIGFVGSTLYGKLREVIRRFRAVRPDVEVVLTELTSLEQIPARADVHGATEGPRDTVRAQNRPPPLLLTGHQITAAVGTQTALMQLALALPSTSLENGTFRGLKPFHTRSRIISWVFPKPAG
jgi:hypothetical protein